jgi:hypothetical protein
MENKIKNAISAVFAEYEDTKELDEFKDEIEIYASEHIKELLATGVNEEEAITRALHKLGDVTEAANLVSRKKRNEVIMNAYIKKVPIGIKHAIGYAVSTLLLLAGLMTAGSVWFGGDRPIAVTSTLLPFVLVSVAGFVFFGLTQETKKHYQMSWKRSLFYVASAILITIGIFVCVTSLWEEPIVFNFDYSSKGYENLIPRNTKISDVMAGGILPFIAPGVAVLLFLITTEKDRKKAWVKKLEEEAAAPFDTPQAEMRFGLISGALWITAFTVFILLTFTVGIKFSWLALVAAVVIQMLVMSALISRKKR